MRLDFSVMKKSKRSSLSFYFFTLLPFYFYIIRIVLLQSGRAEQIGRRTSKLMRHYWNLLCKSLTK